MLNDERKTEQMNRGAIEAELKLAGAVFKGKACTCPFREDKHPSGGVYLCDDGVWRFKCQADSCGFHGDVFDIRAKATGRTLDDVLRDAKPVAVAREANAIAPRVYPSVAAMRDSVRGCTDAYEYTNPDTRAVEMVVLRVQPEGESKRFLQASPTDGGFVMTAPPKPLPIYNRSRVRASDTVVFVEGEKCVHALAAVGVVATTTPGGAGKSEHADLSPLAGKQVYLWPDADPPNPVTTRDGKPHPKPGARTGIDHMREVTSRLEALTLPAVCHWIDCDSLGLDPKGDAADFLDAMEGSSVEDRHAAIMAVLRDATSMGPSGELKERFRAIAAGEYEVISWPWEMVSRGTQALTPGSITILAGDPGSTKSFWLLEAAAYWHSIGVPIALFEVEKDRKWHLNRALAQRAKISNITDLGWVRDNAEQVQRIAAQHTQWADSFGACLYDRRTQSIKLPDMAAWVDRMGAAGKRIICIDPISLCTAGRERFVADEDFMSKVEESVTKHGSSLILVTHPVKGAKGAPSLGNTSGGAVYERESDTVIWVSRYDEAKQVRVKPSQVLSEHPSTYQFARNVTCNRAIKLLKTRNGRGNGWNIAFQFSGDSLTFEELGGILRESKSSENESEVA